jgi:N-methylhydantoinase A
MRHDRVQPVNQMLAQIDPVALGAQMVAVAEQTEKMLLTAGVEFSGIDRLYEFDMLYLGQTHSVVVAIDIPASGLTEQAMQQAFEKSYRDGFGRLLDQIPVRVLNYRVTVVGRRPRLDMTVFAPVNGKPAVQCRRGERAVYVDGQSLTAGVYERLELAVNERIDGPAILEQPDTTIFVDPGLSARVDSFGNLVIKPEA